MNPHHRLLWRRCAHLALMATGLLACPEPIPAPPDTGSAALPDSGAVSADVNTSTDAQTPTDASVVDAHLPSVDAGSVLDAAEVLDAIVPLADTGAPSSQCGRYIRFALHGTITSLESPVQNSLETWRRRLLNQPIRVTITYDSTVADIRQQGDFGQYPQPVGSTTMEILLESIRETYSQPTSFFVEPFNDFQSQGDRLKFVGNYQLEAGTTAQAVVDFNDQSARALTSIALPDTVPVLADYPQGASLSITRSTLSDPESEFERREACAQLPEGEICRYRNEIGQCRDSRRGLICVSVNAWPDRATISARMDRVEDQCSQ